MELNADDLLRDLIDEADAQRLRLDNPYVLDLIAVLLPHGVHGLSRGQVIREVWKRRGKQGVNMPDAFDQTVQASFQQYAGEYAAFRKRNAAESDDLFFAPRGLGAGWWAVRVERATAWLAAKKKELRT